MADERLTAGKREPDVTDLIAEALSAKPVAA